MLAVVKCWNFKTPLRFKWKDKSCRKLGKNTPVSGTSVSVSVCVCLSVGLTLCDAMDSVHVPLSVGFSWQEYWRGWPFPSPGDLPSPRISCTASRFFTVWASRETRKGLWCMPSSFSRLQLLATPGSSVHGDSPGKHWSGLPFPPPGRTVVGEYF